MFVCLCLGITDTQINHYINQNNGRKISAPHQYLDPTTLLDMIKKDLGASTSCGKCTQYLLEIINEHQTNHPILYYPLVSKAISNSLS